MKVKNIFIGAMSLLFLGHNLKAQDIETSVFFESGKQTLTAEAKSKLTNLVKEIKNLNDFELDITAFTDDVGTNDYNKSLASQRAANVKNYLENLGVNATEVKLKEVGELALVGNEEVEIQRSKNRRVEIKVSPFDPKNLGDLYSYNAKRNRQDFEIYPNGDTTIVGKKGSSLFIPANSLVYEDGSAVTNEKIKISLIEVYSNQDIIFSNLSTVSNNNIIETGGMVYIEAKTEDGKKLVVKEGEELQLNLVSEEKLKPDMQLFYSDKHEEAVPKNINWTATNQPFSSIDFGEDPPGFDINSLKINEIQNIKKPEIPIWPNEVPLPVEPKKPHYPKLKSVTFDIGEIKALNPQKTNESDAKYERRIESLVTKSESEITVNEKLNKGLIKSYEGALRKYDVEIKKYQDALLAYKLYRDSVDVAVSFVSMSKYDMKSGLDQFKWSSGFGGDLKMISALMRNFRDYKNYFISECGKYGLSEMVQKTKNMKPETKAIKKLINSFQKCSNTNFAYCKNLNLDILKERIDNIMKQGIKDESEAKLIYGLASSPFVGADNLNSLIDNYNLVLRNSGFINEVKQISDFMDSLNQLSFEIAQIKSDRGILTKKEAHTQFVNSVGINKLGWINCDRFSAATDRITVNLNLEDKKDADIFVIFKDMKSVTKFQKYEEKFSLSGVPKSADVKVIILNLVDGNFEVALKECKIMDLLKNPKFEYNKYNLADLKKILG